MKEIALHIINHLVYPDPYAVFGLMLIILLDLITGVQKGSTTGHATSSRGFRGTIDKAKNYCTLIVTVLVLVNIMALSKANNEFDFAFGISVNTLVFGCIYIEVKSILENLIIINTINEVPNDFCTKLLIPLHNIVIFKLSSKLTNKPLN